MQNMLLLIKRNFQKLNIKKTVIEVILSWSVDIDKRQEEGLVMHVVPLVFSPVLAFFPILRMTSKIYRKTAKSY